MGVDAMERGMISVDRWTDGSQAYFLTHLHADHTQGLSSAWSSGPLFCSRLSAKLLPFKFPGFDLSLLRVLDVGVWHSLSLLSPSSDSKTLVRVMAIDAHHCPGAVMYLFNGDFGSLLYTGDFRWETTSEKANRSRDMLVRALNGSRVKSLYLDNTYCNPSYSFPSRGDAAQQVALALSSYGSPYLSLLSCNAIRIELQKASVTAPFSYSLYISLLCRHGFHCPILSL